MKKARPGRRAPPGLACLRQREADRYVTSDRCPRNCGRDSRAHLALVLALEQRAIAALVAPALLCLLGRAIEDRAIALDAVDVRATQRVVQRPRCRDRTWSG